jgi:F-box-like
MTPHSADFKGDIPRIETEVEGLKRKEDKLLAEVELVRASIQDRLVHISRLNNLYATIGVLPAELLVAIFKSGPSDVIEHQQYIKSISLVSRYWHNLSLAIPSLWSFFHIAPLIGTHSTQLQNLEIFIERSCSHPLSIVIYGDDHYEPGDFSSVLLPQINLIIPLVSRWRTLRIDRIYQEEIADICGVFAELQAPLLESFEVNVEVYDDEFESSLSVFTGGAPRLSYIKVEGIPLMSCLPPLSSLVSLDLGNPPQPLTLVQWRDILTMSNQLRNLHISGDVAHIPFPGTFPAVEIPLLHSLTFSPSAYTSLYQQIVGIKCPALRHLTIEPPYMYNSLSALSSALRWTDRSSKSIYPLLQSLTLRRVAFTYHDGDARCVIAMLPSITRIIIDSCENPEILFDFLVPKDAHESNSDERHWSYWPLLQTIGLLRMEWTAPEFLYKIISDRMSRGIPLVSIQLVSMDVSEDKLDWLRERLHVEMVELS